MSSFDFVQNVEWKVIDNSAGRLAFCFFFPTLNVDTEIPGRNSAIVTPNITG